MNIKETLRQLVLVIGDLVMLYAALFLALGIRKQFEHAYNLNIEAHLIPFSILFAIWILVFSLFSLYDPRVLKNNFRFLRLFGWAILVNVVIALTFFYATPFPGVAPKTNLVLFLVVFHVLFLAWRRFFNIAMSSRTPSTRVLLAGEGREIDELEQFLRQNPQLGYAVAARLPGIKGVHELPRLIARESVSLVAVPHESKNDPETTRLLIENLKTGISVMDTATLYEAALKKISLSSIADAWFIDNLGAGQKDFFDVLTRLADVMFSLLLCLLFIPVLVIFGPAIALTSPGPVIYRQKRIGKNEREFTLYKFRTMVHDAEKNGPEWSRENDARVTPVGRFLRNTHFDELPQIINILRGELSLVGPRPERREFVEQLKSQIPYYDLRHVVRPGATGWAQINYRYGSSIEDAYKKLQYDLYYIKNRSIPLYLMTILKTARVFFSNPK